MMIDHSQPDAAVSLARRAGPAPSTHSLLSDPAGAINWKVAEDGPVGRSVSWLRQTLRRLLANPSTLLGLGLLGVVALLAVLAPLIGRYDPDAIDLSVLNQDPTWSHWFGTDYLGRDMWARVLYGAQISLPVGLAIVALGFGGGVPLGLIAGCGSKLIDGAIMRVMDALLCIPGILLAMGVVAILGVGLDSTIAALGVAWLPGVARVARATALQVRTLGYVEAARAQGASGRQILLRHVLPNCLDPLIALATLSLAGAILATSALSFLGLGTQPPAADWGTLLGNGYQHMFQSWSEVTFPGLALILSVLGINLFGDGLSAALNPRR